MGSTPISSTPNVNIHLGSVSINKKMEVAQLDGIIKAKSTSRDSNLLGLESQIQIENILVSG